MKRIRGQHRVLPIYANIFMGLIDKLIEGVGNFIPAMSLIIYKRLSIVIKHKFSNKNSYLGFFE
uniref:Uncharacterized protein n=1 Tax=Lepeophtheirus salmonis TaxID=72036 RepID=A0A0K2UZX7_LEPSM